MASEYFPSSRKVSDSQLWAVIKLGSSSGTVLAFGTDDGRFDAHSDAPSSPPFQVPLDRHQEAVATAASSFHEARLVREISQRFAQFIDSDRNASASGFEVHEPHHRRSNAAFDYRIVALRRGFESVRLEDMTERWQKLSKPLPELALGRRNTRPVLPPLPTAPAKPNVATPVRLSARR